MLRFPEDLQPGDRLRWQGQIRTVRDVWFPRGDNLTVLARWDDGSCGVLVRQWNYRLVRDEEVAA